MFFRVTHDGLSDRLVLKGAILEKKTPAPWINDELALNLKRAILSILEMGERMVLIFSFKLSKIVAVEHFSNVLFEVVEIYTRVKNICERFATPK